MSRTAAFFDLDRTLIDVNSAILWARAERRDGNLSLVQLVKVLYWAGLYHLSLVNAESTADDSNMLLTQMDDVTTVSEDEDEKPAAALK